MARKRRRRGFGVLYHRGASSYSRKSRTRAVTIRVAIERNIGASRAAQYCAWAKLPRQPTRTGGGGAGGRPPSLRSGKVVCGPTPTVAVKRALRVFIASSWSR